MATNDIVNHNIQIGDIVINTTLEESESDFIRITVEANELLNYIDDTVEFTNNYIYKVFPLILRNVNPTGNYVKEMIIVASYPDEAKILAGDVRNLGLYDKYWTDTVWCQS